MPEQDLTKILEAILFTAGQPVTLNELVKITGQKEDAISAALSQLQEQLSERGIILTQTHKSYQLATSPSVGEYVAAYLQSQLRERLTEAAIETLAIITYKQPISKAEIESIRGVNSQYVLRLLAQRGLIEKISSSQDARLVLYHTTHEFLNHLGISDIGQLPEFEEIIKDLEAATPKATPETSDAPSEVETDNTPQT